MLFVGLGSSTYEFIGLVDRMPYAGTSAEFRQFSSQGSGVTADAMVCLARWGGQTRFIGKVGEDIRGHQIIDSLEEEGVNTDYVIRQLNAVSQLAWILTDARTSETRTFVMEGTIAPLSLDEVPIDAVLKECKHVLVDSRFPIVALPLAKLARLKGIGVTFFAEELSDLQIPIIQNADHVIASERVAGRFVRHSRLEVVCDEILKYGPKRVTITLGPEGVVGKNNRGEYYEVPVYSVDFVDSLGADAAFFAAIAFAEVNQFPFDQMLRFANTGAALVCTGFGPRSYIPLLDDIARCTQ